MCWSSSLPIVNASGSRPSSSSTSSWANRIVGTSEMVPYPGPGGITCGSVVDGRLGPLESPHHPLEQPIQLRLPLLLRQIPQGALQAEHGEPVHRRPASDVGAGTSLGG